MDTLDIHISRQGSSQIVVRVVSGLSLKILMVGPIGPHEWYEGLVFGHMSFGGEIS